MKLNLENLFTKPNFNYDYINKCYTCNTENISLNIKLLRSIINFISSLVFNV